VPSWSPDVRRDRLCPGRRSGSPLALISTLVLPRDPLQIGLVLGLETRLADDRAGAHAAVERPCRVAVHSRRGACDLAHLAEHDGANVAVRVVAHRHRALDHARVVSAFARRGRRVWRHRRRRSASAHSPARGSPAAPLCGCAASSGPARGRAACKGLLRRGSSRQLVLTIATLGRVAVGGELGAAGVEDVAARRRDRDRLDHVRRHPLGVLRARQDLAGTTAGRR